MGNTSPFQMILLGIFGFAIIVSVFVFAIYSGGVNNQALSPVTLWGPIKVEQFNKFISELSAEDERANYIIYRYIPKQDFDRELAEAISSGRGPDLILIDQNQVIKHLPKLMIVPYERYISKRTFIERYIDAAEVFLSRSGIIAFPISADPLILYYNRDIFAEKGIARPPRYWDEVIDATEKIVEKEDDGTITLAGIALGTFDNIAHAKDILTTLIKQKNGDIVSYDPQEGKFFSRLLDKTKTDQPAVSATRLYTDFANPVKYYYSWNKSMPKDIDFFTQYKLGMYIGLMSDYITIKNKNPNLNFDIAALPQVRDDEARTLTGGKIYAVSVTNTTKDPYSAIQIASFLSSPRSVEIFNKTNKTSSPFRGHLENKFEDEIYEIIRVSTIMMRTWLDPDPAQTYSLFKTMIDSILSGRMKYLQAITTANKKLEDILLKLTQ